MLAFSTFERAFWIFEACEFPAIRNALRTEPEGVRPIGHATYCPVWDTPR